MPDRAIATLDNQLDSTHPCSEHSCDIWSDVFCVRTTTEREEVIVGDAIADRLEHVGDQRTAFVDVGGLTVDALPAVDAGALPAKGFDGAGVVSFSAGGAAFDVGAGVVFSSA